MSAYEYDGYLQALTGDHFPAAMVYQPGLPHYYNDSFYRTTNRLDHALSETKQVFEAVRKDMGIHTPGRGERAEDEAQFDEQRYRDFYDRFKGELVRRWQSDPELRQEAEFLYRQMERHGILRFRKARVVDLHATGRTIYYIMAVLDHFSQQAGRPFDRIDGFVGFGRGERVGLPKISHYLPQPNARFSDPPWPFYMTDRDDKTGLVHFRPVPSRYVLTFHIYHSLRLYNDAVQFTKTIKPRLTPSNAPRAAKRNLFGAA